MRSLPFRHGVARSRFITQPDDQLSLWVGRVARVHALLEYSLSNVHGALTPPDTSSVPRTVPANVDLLVRECKRLLETAELSGELIRAGAQALTAAKAANALRNRIVHDIWLPDSRSEEEHTPSWNTFRPSRGRMKPYASSTTRDLDTLITAVDQGMWGRGHVLPVPLSIRAARSTRTVNGKTSAIAFTTVASLAPWARVATETCGTQCPAM